MNILVVLIIILGILFIKKLYLYNKCCDDK